MLALFFLFAFRSALCLKPSSALIGSRHSAILNFGRETNTWMPSRWAASGERVLFTFDIAWNADSTASILNCRPLQGLALGTSTKWNIQKDALYTIDGSTLRLKVKHDGFSVGDCDLDPGDLYLALPIFGSVLSSKPGIMTIIAYRLLIRKERRIVGIWQVSPLPTIN
mmetsp:Transcript_21458/g.27785  ORF Transcript_21458/g.27785 Transcript_21458/m.27785 type:complete len:168 (+) Transcript_21458:890-1393(+)